jgi:predicted membrane GTPase involved in stress response
MILLLILEVFIIFINYLDDELVEVTPKELRIRKKELDSSLRKREKKNAKKIE